MKRLLIVIAALAIVAGVFFAMVSNLQHEPSGRDEAPAVILRAPDGFVVESIGESTFAAAAAALQTAAGDRVGVDFSDNGDKVILIADRIAQEITEMRAARTGTLVERTWPDAIDRRLAWAVGNGNLDAPGLAPATGKNLYH
ncbi:MAG: hypothetical protein QNL88_07725 [Acidobacteriota bacterium]|nr:hypothetical protein [Acidobacteriota bacterium]